MNQSNEDQLQKITPIIKIVKQRQQLYLSLLNFINKNIQSTSNQHQQLTLFSKYLGFLKTQQKQVIVLEKNIVRHFQPDDVIEGDKIQQSFNFVKTVTKNSKQILRLCARLIQIIDTSITKTRHSIFNQDGHLTLQFNRFKRQLHNIIKGQTVHLGQFTTFVLNFVKLKYKKQLAKVEKYVYKLQAGAIVALKDMYMKQRSDQQQGHCVDVKERYNNQGNDNVSKIQKHMQNSQDKLQHGSESQSPKKSVKRPSLSKSNTKKGHKLFKNTKKQPITQSKPKQLTANKLLKHYNMLQLSKKQFLQDMVYEQLEQEQHKRKLMNSLLERNKTIQGQISTYYKKTIVYRQKMDRNSLILSSGEQKEKSKQKKSGDQMKGMPKTSSLRKSFVISKRKSSLNFEKNSKILTENDQSIKGDIFIKTVKHLPVRRKSSAETTQRSLTNKSKKLFVIKSPVVFEDQHIPQAPNPGLTTGGQGWFRPPLTSRKPQKKNENIRLKRRNNPLPIQNSLFNQSFKFTDNGNF